MRTRLEQVARRVACIAQVAAMGVVDDQPADHEEHVHAREAEPAQAAQRIHAVVMVDQARAV
jgi:hypothetical protein